MRRLFVWMVVFGFGLAQEASEINIWLSGSETPAWFINQAMRRTVSSVNTTWPKDSQGNPVVKVRDLPDLGFPLYSGTQHSFAQANTQITLTNVPPPNRPINTLLLSNSPERVTASRGLFHHRLTAAGARLVYHHQNFSGGMLEFNLRLVNPSDKTAWVWLSDANGGPGPDEVFVGHTAVRRWLELHYRQAGQLLALPPRSQFWINRIFMYPKEIISGLLEGLVIEGEGVFLDVYARATGETEPPLETYQQGPVYRLERLDVRTQHTHTAGRATLLSLGEGAFKTLEGQTIKGSWGSFYTYDILLRNPDPKVREVMFQLSADGGIARGVIWLEGELIELPLLKPSQPYELRRFGLKPGEERRITLSTLPASGSNYPLRLLLLDPADPEER